MHIMQYKFYLLTLLHAPAVTSQITGEWRQTAEAASTAVAMTTGRLLLDQTWPAVHVRTFSCLLFNAGTGLMA